MTAPEALVTGRVCADLYPAADQIEKPLSEIDRYDRYVGGFAGNVATGLARLGIRTAIASRVGNDGHGEFVRNFLSNEGVDVTWLGVDPELRTALAFCEVWPPDRFPITFYRTPTCPDWRLSSQDLDMDVATEAPVLLATGTALARSPSRETTLDLLARHREAARPATIFDLDYRPVLWEAHDDYRLHCRAASRLAGIIVGNGEEIRAATGIDDESEAAAALLASGPELVVAKRGEHGCALYPKEDEPVEVGGLDVPVINGLGAGDAFMAGFAAGLIRGLSPAESARWGNAAGAIVATRIACSAAMPTRDELDGLLAGEEVAY